MAHRPKVRQDKKTRKWTVEYYDSNKKQHREKRFRTRRDAEARADEISGEVRKGVHTPTSASGTIEDACRAWIQRARDLKREKKTILQYENHTDLHIIPLTDSAEKPAWPGKLGDLKLAKLTAPISTAVQRELARRLSPPMARKVMVSFKSVINEAVNTGRVAHNAASSVKPERQERGQNKIWPGVQFPSKEEVAAVVAAIQGRWRPLILVLAFCGLRASEARGLEWIDVLGLDTYPQIRVRQRADMDCEIGYTKTDAAQRSVPIPPTVAAALREWKKVCPVDAETGQLRFMFPNGKGHVESHANLYNRGWDGWQIKAGVCEPKRDKNTGKVVKDGEGRVVMTGKYGVHALRHFYASVLIDDGFNPKRVQTLLGHSTIQVTLNIYSHLFPPDEQEDQTRFANMEASVLMAAK
jgi:integrase